MDKNMGIAFIIIAFIVGIGIGFSLTPEYAQMRTEKVQAMMDLGAVDRNLDLRYIDGMIAHHQAAIYLLSQAKQHSKRQEILTLSDEIIKADTEGIAQLYAWKKEWYGNTRKITQFNKVNLGGPDRNFDLRLINAIVNHHDDAISVAKDVMTKSTRNEILNLADGVIRSLGENKVQLVEWRREWYGIQEIISE